jgi:glycosyltransferase involved in cell wall biosynthesis
MHNEPLVSVLTPVYNGELYLSECIESVLAQTYQNFEYVILNNNSTDGTLQIAKHYAGLDKRISVHSNDELLDVISNHNRAFRLASSCSRYCKIVSADDWLFPECLTRLVTLAEKNPSVGIVGSYQVSGGGAGWRDWSVRWTEIPIYKTPFSASGCAGSVVSGREVCRSQLLEGLYVFGTPTSILYRADLVRKQERFYPNSRTEADTSACYKTLQESDFGFVHQVLSYERDMHVHITTQVRALEGYTPSNLLDLRDYGASFLSKEEYERRFCTMMDDYYRLLASSALKFRSREFWSFHERRLNELGQPLSYPKLGKAISGKLFNKVFKLKGNARKAMNKITKISAASVSGDV